MGELEPGNDSKERVRFISHSLLLQEGGLLEGKWRGRGSIQGMGPAVAQLHVLGQHFVVFDSLLFL